MVNYQSRGIIVHKSKVEKKKKLLWKKHTDPKEREADPGTEKDVPEGKGTRDR